MKDQKNGRNPALPLDVALGGCTQVTVLRHLCRSGGGHTGRALGRALNLSHNAVHRALGPLADWGLVDAERQGRATVYRLNETHWLIRDGLRPLFAAEASRYTVLGEAVCVAAGVPVRSVVLFGSEARGDDRPDSDIDLVCLTPTTRDRAAAEARLAAAGSRLRREFGRRLSLAVWTAADFARRYRHRDRLVREIVETGWVIAGTPLSEVLR